MKSITKFNNLNRRYLGITIFFLALFFCTCANNSADHYLFVGTYTGESSEGIYVYRFDAETGSIDSVSTATGVENPSYLTLSQDGSHLYAVNEMADSVDATVSAFSFDKKTGTLTFQNKQSSMGGAPCYVSVDKEDKTAFVANYVGGSVSAFPINDDGSLQSASTTITHQGNSVNNSRQQSPHVHCTVMAPDNRRLYVTDLGTDRLMAYDYTPGDSTLSREPSFKFKAQPGAGPRHLSFHPVRPFAYLINELSGSIVAFQQSTDSLKAIQTISTLPDGYDGPKTGADIHISPDGNFLYASNREELNGIVIYKIDDASGKLSFVGREPSGGIHPRNFMIDPTGRFLLVANRKTDNIVVFKRDKNTGTLSKTGTEIAVSQPVCLKMTVAE